MPRPARAGFVQAACHQFLAGAGLTVNQHARGGVAEAGDHLAQALDGGRMTDQARGERFLPRQPGAQVCHLERQATLLQRAGRWPRAVLARTASQ
jgi:hypothetical protein